MIQVQLVSEVGQVGSPGHFIYGNKAASCFLIIRNAEYMYLSVSKDK